MIPDVCNTSKGVGMLLKKLKTLLSVYDFIDFALLFGSCANGTQKALSDIDVGIHTHRSISLLEQGRIIAELEDALGRKIDLVLLNDLYKKDALLAFRIVDKHQPILCRNNDAYVDFKTYTYKYYFDVQPMYEMFDKALFERLKNGTYAKAQAS